MDLPTCPACKQSVLDDDAELCPFCGSSMSGKPVSRTAAPAAPPLRAGKPGAATGAKSGGPRKTGDSSPDMDAPFDVEVPAASTIPVGPKKTSARTMEVVCPMCETPGFIPESAAGREVKCHNKSCMVPVFTAPAAPPRPVATPVAPPPEASNRTLVMGSILAVIFAVAGASFWLLTRTPPAEKMVDPFADFARNKAAAPATGTGTKPVVPAATDKMTAKVEPEVVPPPQAKPADVAQQILPALVDAAQKNENNRNKPFCRRLTGVAYARIGDPAGAREQIERMSKLKPDVPYFQIEPLVAIGWQQLAAGQAQEARATAETARELTKTVPKFGRDAIDALLQLATLLAALGADAEAEAVIAQNSFEGPLGQLSARLAIVRALGSYNLDQTLPGEVVGGWERPQWVASTLGVAVRGDWERAEKWARQAPDSVGEAESLIAWADALARQALVSQKAGDFERAAAIATDLDPANRARLHACLSLTAMNAGNRERAEQALTQAQTALGEIAVPSAVQFMGLKELFDLKLPEEPALRYAALAAAEVSQAQARLEKSAEAWESLKVSMSFARGIAPSPAALQAQEDQLKKQGATLVRSSLKSIFGLTSHDQARRKYNDLTRKITQVSAAATGRFDLQLQILESAAGWGLSDQVWKEALARSEASDANLREPFLASVLPARVADLEERAGRSAAGAAIREHIADMRVTDPLLQLRSASERALTAKDYKGAAAACNQFGTLPEAEEWMLQLAGRSAAQADTAAAFEFVSDLQNVLVREEALRLVSAQLARKGAAEALWTFAPTKDLPQTERIAWGCGIIEGATAPR